jgi:hypothetical protein
MLQGCRSSKRYVGTIQPGQCCYSLCWAQQGMTGTLGRLGCGSQPSAPCQTWHVLSLPPGQQCRMISLLRRRLLHWYGSGLLVKLLALPLQSLEEASCQTSAQLPQPNRSRHRQRQLRRRQLRLLPLPLPRPASDIVAAAPHLRCLRCQLGHLPRCVIQLPAAQHKHILRSC